MNIDLKSIQNGLTPQQKYAKLTPGKTQVRFVSFTTEAGKKELFQHTGYHTLLGGFQICPKKTEKMPCPICEKASEAYRASTFNNKGDDPLYKSLKASDRYYWLGVVRGQEDSGVLIISLGSKLTKALVDAMVDLNTDITDPQTGADVVIKKEGSGLLTSYGHTILNPSPLGTPEQIEEWLSTMPDLTAETRVQGYDELEALVNRFLALQGSGQVPSRSAGPATPQSVGEANRIHNLLDKR